MKGRFFKNITYMSFGTFFKLFVAFISTAIYIRTIGFEGYAIIGIVFSFFGLVSRFDIPYFLSLLKYNSNHFNNKRHYESTFNTLYTSVLFSNVLFFLFLLPFVLFLSKAVYNDPNLIIFYVIALFVFLFSRVDEFLKDFIRANQQETIIQRATVVSLTSEFLITLFLLFILNFGVLSIFIGAFIAKFLEFSLLCYFTKNRLIQYRPYFSFNLLVKVFKKCTIPNYFSNLLGALIFSGGLFVSTIFLDTTSIGILTIFVSISGKLREILAPVWFHLAPIYTQLAIQKNFAKIKIVMKHTVFLFIIMFIILIVFLSVGEPLYLLYLGSQLDGTYFAFLLLLSSQLFAFIFVNVTGSYIFATNIKLFVKINFISAIVFFLHLFPLIQIYGLIGAVVSFFIVHCLRGGVLLAYFWRMCGKKLDKGDMVAIMISLISLAACLLMVYSGVTLNPSLAAISFVIVLCLIIMPYARKIKKSVCYIASEI